MIYVSLIMLRFSSSFMLMVFVCSMMFVSASETKDIGVERVGRVMAIVYVGTNDEVSKLGKKVEKSPEISAKFGKKLRSIKKMRFRNYRELGKDTQPVFRSYENWLSPLKPSKQILLSFESQGKMKDGGLKLDLELWQHKRKVMKSDTVLRKGQPLLILGPKWRGGHLIISVELVD